MSKIGGPIFFRGNASKSNQVSQEAEDFAKKFVVPIAFLSSLLLVTVFLVVLYLALKRDLFNCSESSKNEHDEEEQDGNLLQNEQISWDDIPMGASADNFCAAKEADDFYIEDLEVENNGLQREDQEYYITGGTIVNEAGSVENTELDMPSASDSQSVGENTTTGESGAVADSFEESERTSSEDMVTKSSFVREKPTRPLLFKKVLSRIKKPKVQSEGMQSEMCEEYPLTSRDGFYGSVPQAGTSLTYNLSTVSLDVVTDKYEVRGGKIQLAVRYMEESCIIEVAVKQGKDLNPLGEGRAYWQTRLALLPHKRHRFRTKFKPTSTPIFKEVFKIKDIPVQVLCQLGLRLRVYGKLGKTGLKKFAGEAYFELDRLEDDSSDEWIVEWLDLELPNTGRLQIA